MSCDYDVVDYAKGLAHLCFGNTELSRQVCRLAIECRQHGKRPNALIVLKYLLKLEDTDAVTGENLQLKRLEWVFGTA